MRPWRWRWCRQRGRTMCILGVRGGSGWQRCLRGFDTAGRHSRTNKNNDGQYWPVETVKVLFLQSVLPVLSRPPPNRLETRKERTWCGRVFRKKLRYKGEIIRLRPRRRNYSKVEENNSTWVSGYQGIKVRGGNHWLPAPPPNKQPQPQTAQPREGHRTDPLFIVS